MEKTIHNLAATGSARQASYFRLTFCEQAPDGLSRKCAPHSRNARAMSRRKIHENRTVITNHARGVYIIKTKFCISPTHSVVYHQVAGEYTLMRGDMHLR